MIDGPLRLAVVGCGNIARAYAATLTGAPAVKIVGATDLDSERAAAFVADWGGRHYQRLTAVLDDPGVDLVLNLTTQEAHVDVIRAAIDSGKHVYSEKPLAFTPDDAFELVRRAEAKGVRFACAPMTFLGEAQQTAWKALRDGRIGQIKLAYAEANWGRLEDWHPDPRPFYKAGALFDVAPYAVTYLTTVLGPARSVCAMATVALAERTRKDKTHFRVESPDVAVGLIEFESGAIGRLTANFYVHKQNSKQRGIEFHGDQGSLHLGCWQSFDAPVELAAYGEPFAPLPLLRSPYVGTEWGRGIVEMAEAIAADRPHRVTGEHAAHVTEILSALDQSRRTARSVRMESSFVPPPPMEWAV